MIRLACLVLLAYLLALPLWAAAIAPQPSPWVQLVFVIDLIGGAALFVVLMRRLLA